MPLNIQNLEARARQVGRSVEDFSSDLRNALTGDIRQSANVITNGIRSSVEASANELTRALNEVTAPFKALSNLFGRSSGGGASTSGVSLAEVAQAAGIKYTGGPLKNSLSKYASYNCIFTLGVLSNDEVNYPDDTYRKNGPSIVVLRSGGTGNNQVQTEYDRQRNIRTEYYIDNVSVDTIIAPNPKTKQTNATSINFQVTEPYSMGLFLQSIMVAALQGGHKSYLDAPYLLYLEFIGWDDNGNPINLPGLRRMFPLKFINIGFQVTEMGSVYEIEAIPWHEQAFADEIQAAKTDIDIKGATIVELLQTGPESLSTILNNRELELKNSGNKKTADQYVILFPNSRSTAEERLAGGRDSNAGATTQTSGSSDTTSTRNLTEQRRQELYEQISGIQNGQVPADFDAELSKVLGIVVRRSKLGESIRDYAERSENVNAIGRSKIVKSYLDEGTQYFGKPAFSRDPNNEGVFTRGNITISDQGRRINFKKGARVQDIIEEVILLSEYGRQFAVETPNTNGMKRWFKIEADVYNITDSTNVDQTGATPKIYVYRVIPYEVQTARINSPTQSTPGISNLKKQALKEYNYIYTGANDDIINFDIRIDSAFFTAIQSDFGQLTQSSKIGSANSLAEAPPDPVHGQNEGNSENISSSGTAQSRQSTGPNTGKTGSGPQNHPETQIARAFNDAIVNSPVDLVTATMEIWGDPYYIADSGMGNYNAPEVAGAMNITADGSMDYQYSEVDVLVNFRTPLDIGNDGLMDFPGLGTQPVGSFSGLYQVLFVKNKFESNKFTQELEMVRRRNQDTDATAQAPSQNTEAVVERGGAAVISPTASTPAGSFAGTQTEGDAGEAEARANVAAASQGGTGGQASQGDSELSAALNEPTRAPIYDDAILRQQRQRESESIRARINDRDQAGRIRGGL